MRYLKNSLLLFLFFFSFNILKAQNKLTQEKDISDLFTSKSKTQNPEKKDTGLIQKKMYSSFLPIIGYGPANGFVIGGGASFSKLLGDPKTTRLSTGLMNLNITSKKQTYINLRTNIYTKNEDWILQGDWRLMFFAQPTYGLGISESALPKFIFSLNGIETEEGDQEQAMRFNYIRLYENAYKKVATNFYVGVGINFDYHFKIADEKLNLDLPVIIPTSHYLYSSINKFGLSDYSTNGFLLSALYDSRDNSINSYKGSFCQINYRVNPTWLGSSQSSSTIFYDARTYLKIVPSAIPHMLALWSWGQFLTSGKMPYLALPSISWDMYNRSGRGYIQGRFRGENMVYTEAEYRFPILSNGLLGGVCFLNSTSASNNIREQKLFNSFAFGYGTGLRLKMSKKTRTNIGMDLGFGNYHSGGVYFSLQEAF